MIVTPLAKDPLQHPSPLLVLLLFQGEELAGISTRVDEALGGSLSLALTSGDMKGKMGDSLLFYLPDASGDDSPQGPERVLILGAGSKEKCDAEVLRKLMGQAVREAEKRSIDRIAVWLEPVEELTPAWTAQAATEGAVLAAWSFRELKSQLGSD